MFEHWVAQILNRLLGEYVKQDCLDADRITTDVMHGASCGRGAEGYLDPCSARHGHPGWAAAPCGGAAHRVQRRAVWAKTRVGSP